MLVPSAVKKAIPIIASESGDRIELTSRASVTGQSVRFAADAIIASLVKDSDFIWNVQSVKPEYFLRVIPGTGSQGDEIHHGMRAILTYLTRDEDNSNNVMKRDLIYEGWWQFKYSQEDASPDLDQGFGHLTAPSLDQKSRSRTKTRDQSDASWNTPSDLGFRAKMYLRRSKAAQESHQRRRRRWENTKDYASLVNRSDRTGIISEWLAGKFSRPSTKTQSGETVISRILGSISDYLGTYADEHRGSLDSRSTRIEKSKEGGCRDPNVIFDTNDRKIYSPLHKRPRTAWNDIKKARRRIRNVHGYEVSEQKQRSRPRRRLLGRGGRDRSESSVVDEHAYGVAPDSTAESRRSLSNRQPTLSIPLTNDAHDLGPDLTEQDSGLCGQDQGSSPGARLEAVQAQLTEAQKKFDEICLLPLKDPKRKELYNPLRKEQRRLQVFEESLQKHFGSRPQRYDSVTSRRDGYTSDSRSLPQTSCAGPSTTFDTQPSVVYKVYT